MMLLKKYNCLLRSGIIALIFICLTSCHTTKKDIAPTNLKCYSFDQRQCATDAFGPSLNKLQNPTKKEIHLKEFLERKGLKVHTIKMVEQYHGAVCEACDICPEQHRFFIKSNHSPEDFSSLNLLNFERIVCNKFP